jgi:hypothetical protein
LLDGEIAILNSHLYISLAMALIGTVIALLFYSVCRRHLLYWL